MKVILGLGTAVALTVALSAFALADGVTAPGPPVGGFNAGRDAEVTVKPGDSIQLAAAIQDQTATAPTGSLTIEVAADKGATVTNDALGGAQGCDTPGPDITCTYPVGDLGPPGNIKGDSFHVAVPQDAQSGDVTVTVTVTDSNGPANNTFTMHVQAATVPAPTPTPSPSPSPSPATTATTPGLPNTGHA